MGPTLGLVIFRLAGLMEPASRFLLVRILIALAARFVPCYFFSRFRFTLDQTDLFGFRNKMTMPAARFSLAPELP